MCGLVGFLQIIGDQGMRRTLAMAITNTFSYIPIHVSCISVFSAQVTLNCPVEMGSPQVKQKWRYPGMVLLVGTHTVLARPQFLHQGWLVTSGTRGGSPNTTTPPLGGMPILLPVLPGFTKEGRNGMEVWRSSNP